MPILDVKVAIYLPLEKYVEDALLKSKSRAIAALDAAKTVQGALDEEEEGPSGLDIENTIQGAPEEERRSKPLPESTREIVGNK